MAKFKIGDKVKLITLKDIGEYHPHLKVGDVGIITDYLSQGIFVVKFEKHEPDLRNQYAFDDFELELAD